MTNLSEYFCSVGIPKPAKRTIKIKVLDPQTIQVGDILVSFYSPQERKFSTIISLPYLHAGQLRVDTVIKTALESIPWVLINSNGELRPDIEIYREIESEVPDGYPI